MSVRPASPVWGLINETNSLVIVPSLFMTTTAISMIRSRLDTSPVVSQSTIANWVGMPIEPVGFFETPSLEDNQPIFPAPAAIDVYIGT